MKYFITLFLLICCTLSAGDKFDNEFYDTWQQARLKVILDHYGKDWFKGKKILEVGAGYGFFSSYFQSLGADCTGSDARLEYVHEMRQRGLKAVQADLDDIHWKLGTDWDMIIHFGVLYHLGDPVIPIIQACNACKHLIIETAVCDGDNPHFIWYRWEPAEKWDGAYNYLACQPTPQAVERVFDYCGAKHKVCLDPRLNVCHHNYTWKCTNTYEEIDGHRRFWFVECN